MEEYFHVGPDIVYKDFCKECGLPVDKYEKLNLCNYCAEGMFEETEEAYNA